MPIEKIDFLSFVMLLSVFVGSDTSVAVEHSLSSSTELALLEIMQSNGILAEDSDDGFFVTYNPSSSIRSLHGSKMTLSFEVDGCCDPRLEEQLSCFIASNRELLSLGESNLELVSVSRLSGTDEIAFRYSQNLQGTKILGSQAIFVVTSDGNSIRTINSSLIARPYANIQVCETSFGYLSNLSSERISIACGGGWKYESEAKPVFLADHGSSTSEIRLGWQFDVNCIAGKQLRATLDVSSDQIVLIRDRVDYYLDAARRVISDYRFPAVSLDSCSNDSDCTDDQFPRCTSENDGLCAGLCTSSSDCTSFGANWVCVTPAMEQSEFTGMCKLLLGYKDEGYGDQAYVPYTDDFGGWNPFIAANIQYYSRALEAVDNVRNFFYLGFGRNSMDDANGAINLLIYNDPLANSTYTRSLAGVFGDVLVMNRALFTGDLFTQKLKRMEITGHEASHVMRNYIFQDPNDENYDCLNELFGSYFGKLTGRYRCPGKPCASNVDCANTVPSGQYCQGGFCGPDDTMDEYCGWYYQDPDGMQTIASSWGDPWCGMNPNCYNGFTSANIPYLPRTRYDWLPCWDERRIWGTSCQDSLQCPPYQFCNEQYSTQQLKCTNLDIGITSDYGLDGCAPGQSENYWDCLMPIIQNDSVMSRFARYLSEGSRTSERDGQDSPYYRTGENPGEYFDGVGDLATFQLSYNALVVLPASSRIDDYFFHLLNEGYYLGIQDEVAHALGAIGVAGKWYRVGSNTMTGSAPRGLVWPEYTLSQVKELYAYKQYGSSDLVVRRHNGIDWTDYLGSGDNLGETPAVAIYGSYLYVFWRDATTSDICGRRFSQGFGYTSKRCLTSTLGMSDMYSGGSIDAVVANGSLFLGYVRPGGNSLTIARCNDSINCLFTPDAWETYISAFPNPTRKYRTISGTSTSDGVGLVSGVDLNGAAVGEYIYAILSKEHPGYSDDRDISIAQIISTHSQGSLLAGTRTMNVNLAHHKALKDAVRALEIRQSAFNEEGEYLFLSWLDGEGEIPYTSVLRDWSGNGWYTKPVVIGSTESASTAGITYLKNDGENRLRYLYQYDLAGNKLLRYRDRLGKY